MKELEQNNFEIELIDTIDTKEENKNISDLLVEYGINNIDNPFKNISVKEVAKDLHIGKNKAYELFQQKDFPSINIGRSWKIMYLSYLIWKMEKRV
jgi:hypothetical protein